MSGENAEALKRGFAAARENRADEFYDLLDEDIVWDVGDFPGGRFHGRDGVREFFRQWVGTFEDWAFDVRESIDAGHAVFVHMHQRGRGKTSGAATEIDFWQVWLFLDGKVVRFVQKPDRESALRTAGLLGEGERNIDTVRQIYSDWEQGNFWTVEHFHPEVHVQWFDPIVAPPGGETRGLEELARGMREVLNAYDQITARAERIVAAGDQVVSVELWHGRGKASGIETESRNSSLWRFAEGKVIHLANYGTPDGAFKAAGISDPDGDRG